MIGNGECTLYGLFDGNRLVVPHYQRSYAWKPDPQLATFLKDLEQHKPLAKLGKPYFLGTILLTGDADSSGTDRNVCAIVDGQQRITTAVIFIAAALRRLRRLGCGNIADTYAQFIGSRANRNLQTIDQDGSFFDRFVLGNERPSEYDVETPSMRRLQRARTFFDEQVAQENTQTIQRYLETLATAKVLIYAVETASEATQVFEFQNDRGKRLTDLEALKSFLMHRLYLTDQDTGQTEGSLRAVQNAFAKLYRSAERIDGLLSSPGDDAILGFHCVAFENYRKLDGGKDGWRHPKRLVRELLADAAALGEAEPDWIINFSARLCDTFGTVLAILEARDRYDGLGALFVLRRVASFWPLLIKCWSRDHSDGKSDFDRATKAMERFAFRSALAGTRADTGVEILRRDLANPFDGDFGSLMEQLGNMAEGYWNVGDRFRDGLDDSGFYSKTPENRYLLWRYENSLRLRSGKKQTLVTWYEMLNSTNDGLQITIDHIIPQNPEHGSEKAILEQQVRWAEEDEKRAFKDVFLHRLGNLVLATRSGNSSKTRGRSTKKQTETLQASFKRRSNSSISRPATSGGNGRFGTRLPFAIDTRSFATSRLDCSSVPHVTSLVTC